MATSNSSELGDRLATQAAAERAGQTTGVAKKKGPLTVMGWMLEETTKGEVARALPRGIEPARFMRQVMTELRKNPKLQEADPKSFILAVLYFAQLGLELGPLGQAYLTGPFNIKHGNRTTLEVVPVIGYKGLSALAYRSDRVDLVDAVSVHEGEPFKVVRGSDPRIEHEELPQFAAANIVAYYAIATMKGSSRVPFEVMYPADIEKIRARSKAGNIKGGPWDPKGDDYEAMAKKTVLRRLLNRGKVPLETQVLSAIAKDELLELGLDHLPELPEGPADKEPEEGTAAAGAGQAAAETAGGTETAGEQEKLL